MKKGIRIALGMSLLAAMLGMHASVSQAASCPQIKSQWLSIARSWAKIKYLSRSKSARKSGMEKLGARADALARHYPNCVEALIWDGIVTSERASLTWGYSALKLATRARDILRKAYRMSPSALDAGAPTSLGVLYYRVPGFPLAWGDKKKARRLLAQAVRLAPKGRDAHYFYADFLYNQGEYRKAEQVLLAGLNTPNDPERPLWSRVFPRVMRGLLAKIRKREGKS
jgi:tetratricopeptide (TPR) repeat protein